MNLNINIKNIIPNYIEKYIIKKINLDIPNVFRTISDDEIDYIKIKIKSKFNIDIDSNIICSIKSAFIKNYIINTHYKLDKYKNKIYERYNNKENIIYLSKRYKLSPMTIMRFILENKYNKKIKLLYYNLQILEEYDKNQFKIALENDIYNQIEQSESLIESEKFEKQIEEILKKYNIKFKTQQDLIIEQKEKYGYVKYTPDFLILDDLKINNKSVKWIDAKNFYGSNIKFVIKNINNQIKKYIEFYGPGCIIFKYGFNDNLYFDKTLLLSIESL